MKKFLDKMSGIVYASTIVGFVLTGAVYIDNGLSSAEANAKIYTDKQLDNTKSDIKDFSKMQYQALDSKIENVNKMVTEIYTLFLGQPKKE